MTPADRILAWLHWFGTGRLVAGALSTVIVCAGAFWLVRTPPPPTEATLPVATTTIPTDSSPVPPAPVPAGPVTAVSGPATVLVHVTGAVVAPGVYELPAGARVRDAIVVAGGATVAADDHALNLAAVVVDASRIHVPAVGEELPIPIDVAAAPVGPAAPLDVNRATAEQLDELPGVGPATADAIVAERDRHGPFVDVDDLLRVPGIGPAKLEALRDSVTT
ncbi:MAG TPA: ComEA family DNA-binding protein [Ilumatobacteraceae bacterium]|nr:ComEA family DNA-binding protein [Ilumatobacteraceae bacterium]